MFFFIFFFPASPPSASSPAYTATGSALLSEHFVHSMTDFMSFLSSPPPLSTSLLSFSLRSVTVFVFYLAREAGASYLDVDLKIQHLNPLLQFHTALIFLDPAVILLMNTLSCLVDLAQFISQRCSQ